MEALKIDSYTLGGYLALFELQHLKEPLKTQGITRVEHLIVASKEDSELFSKLKPYIQPPGKNHGIKWRVVHGKSFKKLELDLLRYHKIYNISTTHVNIYYLLYIIVLIVFMNI